MPTTTRFCLHVNGPALWPEHKPLAEVLALRATTPEPIWECTYQGNPTPPAGMIFRREWWRDARFDPENHAHVNSCVARWISWDTAMKDEETNAYTACVIGELWPDYRLAVREVWRDRLEFPELPVTIETIARRYNRDEKLRGIIIEDKASGTSAYQTLSASSEEWLRPLLVAFQPVGDKVQRAQQAGVWCRNGCVLLPRPGPAAPWLVDFEDELFTFPGSIFKDQVDAFDQLILYVENLLAEGWRARSQA